MISYYVIMKSSVLWSDSRNLPKSSEWAQNSPMHTGTVTSAILAPRCFTCAGRVKWVRKRTLQLLLILNLGWKELKGFVQLTPIFFKHCDRFNLRYSCDDRWESSWHDTRCRQCAILPGQGAKEEVFLESPALMYIIILPVSMINHLIYLPFRLLDINWYLYRLKHGL